MVNSISSADPNDAVNQASKLATPLTPAPASAQFVTWLRQAAPYIHAHRGKTFVIAFGGELVEQGLLTTLIADISLLRAMGMRIVVVHGSRPQVQAQLALKGLSAQFAQGLRITDAAALECAKEAAGEIRLDIEAAFSQGLPNTPMAHAEIRVVSGNFITARPVGIVEGVDFQHTGVVRKVAADSIRQALDMHTVVLLSPLGFSPTGEAFNLAMEDVAASVAGALHAEKLIFLTQDGGVFEHTRLLQDLSATQAERLMAHKAINDDTAFYLNHALKACRAGVSRVHLLPYAQDGALLLELFTHDGVGSMMAATNLESLRPATIEDVGGLLKLIEPLEADGTLVKRGRDKLEREIDFFSVIEHDGVIFGCVALYSFAKEHIGEMACLTVAPEAQGTGDGERLMHHIEEKARALGLQRLFVLTTRTAHWFLKRGFVMAHVDDLPADKQRMYNYSRKSQVLIKTL